MVSAILYIAFSILVGVWASHRGRSAVLWAIAALLISPILAVIILAVLKDLSVKRELERNRMEYGMFQDRAAASEAELHSRMDHVEQRMDHVEGRSAELNSRSHQRLPEGASFCPQCGMKLQGNEVFCPGCGTKLRQEGKV